MAAEDPSASILAAVIVALCWAAILSVIGVLSVYVFDCPTLDVSILAALAWVIVAARLAKLVRDDLRGEE